MPRCMSMGGGGVKTYLHEGLLRCACCVGQRPLANAPKLFWSEQRRTQALAWKGLSGPCFLSQNIPITLWHCSFQLSWGFLIEILDQHSQINLLGKSLGSGHQAWRRGDLVGCSTLFVLPRQKLMDREHVKPTNARKMWPTIRNKKDLSRTMTTEPSQLFCPRRHEIVTEVTKSWFSDERLRFVGVSPSDPRLQIRKRHVFSYLCPDRNFSKLSWVWRPFSDQHTLYATLAR